MSVARAFYNKIADTYEAGFGKAYWRLYDQITAEIIAKHLPREPSLILDAGGGTGRWAVAMAREGHKVVLLDVSEKMLEVARERIRNNNLISRVTTIHSDIRKMELNDNNFDLVVAEGAISYCGASYQKAIDELVRVAKHGSYILASVNNRYGLALTILKKFDLKEGVDHIDRLLETGEAFTDLPVHAFTLDGLKESFRKAGAEVINAYGKHTLSNFLSREQKEELEDEKVFKKFEKFEKLMMDKPELIGFAGHILVVARKF